MYTTLTADNLSALYRLVAAAYAVCGDCDVLVRRRRALVGPELVLGKVRGGAGLGFELLIEENFAAGDPDPWERHTLMVTPDPAMCIFSVSEGYTLKGQYNLPEYLALTHLDGLDVVVFDKNADPLPFRA